MPQLSQKQYMMSAAVILFVAAFVRMTGIAGVPPGLHFDEATNATITSLIAFEGYRPIFIPDFTGKEVLWFYLAALLVRVAGGSVFVLRFASVLMGLATIAAAGWSVRALFPERTPAERRWLSLFTMAVLAGAFWLAVLNRIPFRANAQPLLMALTVGALFTAWQREGRQRWLWMVAAGVLTGLSAYTYLAVRLFPLLLLVIWVAALIAQRHRIGPALLELLAYGLTSTLIVLPMLLYFVRNPERFLTRINQVSPQTSAEAWQGWQAALGMLFIEGDPLLRFNIPGRPIFGWVLAAFFLIGWVLCLRGLVKTSSGVGRVRSLMLTLWPAVFLAPTALAVGAITPSNLRAIGLAPYIALYPALGIVWLLSIRRQPNLPFGALAILLFVGAGSSVLSVRQWGQNAQLHYDYDAHVAAMGRYLDRQTSDLPTYTATIHYRHPTLQYLSERESASLFGGRAVVLPEGDQALLAFTRDAGFPSEWRQALAPYQVAAPLGPDAEPQFEVYRLDASLPLLSDDGTTANFANIVQLEGAQFTPAPSGGVAQVDATWRVLNHPPRTDYIFNAQVCDQWGWCWLRVQSDGSIQRGENASYLASEWTPGERIVTRFDIPLPKGVPPGDYEVRFGVFSTGEQTPLPLIDESGAFDGINAAVSGLQIEPATVGITDDVPVQVPREQAISPDIIFFGHDISREQLRPGEQFDLAFYWLALINTYDRLNVRVYLNDDLFLEREPVRGTYPTSEWEAGELVIDRYTPRIPRDFPAGEYTLSVEIGPSSRFDIDTLTVRDVNRAFALPEGLTPLAEPARFTNGITLAGYSLQTTDESLTLRLGWQVEQLQERGYTVFTHLIDEEGRIITQQDRPPVVNGELYPFDLWQEGEIAVDDGITLALPPDETDYRLRVGLYTPENGDNIPLQNGDTFFILPQP